MKLTQNSSRCGNRGKVGNVKVGICESTKVPQPHYCYLCSSVGDSHPYGGLSHCYFIQNPISTLQCLV